MSVRSDILPPHLLYRVAWGNAVVASGLTVAVAYLSEIPWVLRLLPPIGLVLTLIGVSCAGVLLRRSGFVASAPWLHHLALGANVIFFFGFFLKIVGR